MKTVKGAIRYLGFEYVPSTEPFVPPEHKYWTGESFAGQKIYLPAGPGYEADSPVPMHVYRETEDGGCQCHIRSQDTPVYPYVRNGSCAVGETIDFGLVNARGGMIELPNTAPWVIERMTAKGWEIAFSPMFLTVIVPVPEGSTQKWSWDLKTDDGTAMPPGDYRVTFRYRVARGQLERSSVEFRIDPGSPAVAGDMGADYDKGSADMAFFHAPQVALYNDAYADQGYSTGLRDDLVSEMLFKATVKGLDPGQLMTAIRATGVYAHGHRGLPCLAIHTRFRGSPVWAIVYAIQLGHMFGAPHFYMVDDATGKVVYENALK